MADQERRLSRIQRRIVEALRAHPDGLTIREIGEIVSPGEFQQEMNRRVRELYPHYEIERRRRGRDTVYVLTGEKAATPPDSPDVGQTQRARILHRDKGRCQMCGKTIEEDGIKLHIDHKIPREWGGETVDENLWALCAECNLGKKNYFASFDPEDMREVLRHRSVHRRIAMLLRLRHGEWVDSDLIQFVAGFHGFQSDWPKRTRELRYLGLEIESQRVKRGKRSVSQYRLTKWVELPEDPTKVAREYEAKRARRNKAAGQPDGG